jgi:thiosulfate/3-mercaptopyruvate sulfurtransferase
MVFPLVTPDWLAQHLGDPGVVVVDCRFDLADPGRGQQQYAASHIPGAWYLDLNRDMAGPVQAHGGRHPLPDLAVFSARLGQIGVASAGPQPTLVVAYDDSRFAFAARLWWLLRYLGHSHVAVLDGGWGGWVQAGHPTTVDLPTTDLSTGQAAQFIPAPQTDWVVDIDMVRRRQAGVLLIDSRSPERYRGEVELIDPVAGSIPGAVNYFWHAVSTPDGRMQSAEALAQHWAALDAAQETIVYCGSGVTACVNLLAQAVADRPMAKLYPGGWSDWCSYLER